MGLDLLVGQGNMTEGESVGLSGINETAYVGHAPSTTGHG